MPAILVPEIKMEKDGYIFGFDSPTTANFGYAVFQYQLEDNSAEYVESGTFDLNGGYSDYDRFMNLKGFLTELTKDREVNVFTMERSIGKDSLLQGKCSVKTRE